MPWHLMSIMENTFEIKSSQQAFFVNLHVAAVYDCFDSQETLNVTKVNKVSFRILLDYFALSLFRTRRARTATWSSARSAGESLRTPYGSFLRPRTKPSWRSARCLRPKTASRRRIRLQTVTWNWRWWTATDHSGSMTKSERWKEKNNFL